MHADPAKCVLVLSHELHAAKQIGGGGGGGGGIIDQYVRDHEQAHSHADFSK